MPTFGFLVIKFLFFFPVYVCGFHFIFHSLKTAQTARSPRTQVLIYWTLVDFSVQDEINFIVVFICSCPFDQETCSSFSLSIVFYWPFQGGSSVAVFLCSCVSGFMCGIFLSLCVPQLFFFQCLGIGYITKTSLSKYTEHFTTKKWKFLDKKCMFLSRNQKIMYTPVNPSFTI